jgi:predicted N-acetyltransferase YhbS
MDLRIARHTQRLPAVVAFYRDALGLPEIGGFRGHDGYDGVFLEVPGTGAHLEFTAGGEHGAPQPHAESVLVLYLGDDDAVATGLRRLAVDPLEPANPYWAGHGVTVADPDGFRVVLVPEAWSPGPDPVEIAEHTGPRAELRELFELADDSAAQIDAYIDAGRVLVARLEGEVVGHLQLTDCTDPLLAEIKNMAVRPSHQRRGIGRALIAAALELARGEGRAQVIVATAAAGVGELAFYQRAGFRLRSIERDAFTPAAGYPAGTMIDGIELRDRVWLDAQL